MAFAALKHGGDESGTAAGAVLGEQEVKFVVDAHHLGDSALHHVLEMRMVSEIKGACHRVSQGLIKGAVHRV